MSDKTKPSMLYLPADSETALDRIEQIEYLMLYCLEREKRGNVKDYDDPPVKWDLYHDFVFYHREGRKGKIKAFQLYNDWRIKWGIKHPDHPLPESSGKKPTEALTEKAVHETLSFYLRLHWLVYGVQPLFTTNEFCWYDGAYSLTYPLPDNDHLGQTCSFPTRKAAKAFIVEQIQVLRQKREDCYLFMLWQKSGTSKMDHVASVYETRVDGSTILRNFTQLERANISLSFPDPTAAAEWFHSQLSILESWGISAPEFK